jgi:hypothetical protein
MTANSQILTAKSQSTCVVLQQQRFGACIPLMHFCIAVMPADGVPLSADMWRLTPVINPLVPSALA